MIKNKEIKNLPYHWSLIGGILFLILAKVDNLFLLLNILKISIYFISGIVLMSVIIFCYNKMLSKKTKKAFLVFLTIFSPFIISIMAWGNSLGTIEMFVYGAIALLLFLIIIIFILINPKKIKKRSLILLFLLVFFSIIVIFNKDSINGEIRHFNCERRGGNYYNGSDYCHFKNKNSIKKNLFGVQINIPGNEEQIATLLFRKGNSLIGNILDSKTNSRIRGSVELYSEKITMLGGPSEFIIPFMLKYKNDKYYYLGLFQTDSRNAYKDGYSFYDKINHIDSYFIGRNIKLGNTKLGKHGLHDGKFYGSVNVPVFQEYYEEGAGKKKEIELRVDKYKQSKFYLYKKCENIGVLIKKKKGNGEFYEVCIMKNGGQCTPDAYRRGVCPMEGFKLSEFLINQDRDKIPYNIEAKSYCLAKGILNVDGTCWSTDGTVCPMEDYYNGKCD